jgi:hypothetical protein
MSNQKQVRDCMNWDNFKKLYDLYNVQPWYQILLSLKKKSITSITS